MISDNSKAHLLLIAAIVVLFNLQAVFGLNILIQDDNSRYLTAINDAYRYDYPWRSFLGLRSDLMWFLISVLTHSASLARLLVLALFMVPLSLLFYVFNRQVLGLPVWVSFGSAVIAQIIPSMYQIPAFIDGAYPAPGLLAFVASMLIAQRYLRSSRFQTGNFALWCLALVLANDVMVEMGVLLFPSLLFFVYIADGSLKKKAWLYTSASLICLVRLFMYFDTYGHPTNSVTQLQVEEVANRIAQTFAWWLPVPVNLNSTLVLTILALTVAGVLMFKKRLLARLDSADRTALVFYGLWFAGTTLPFWFMSANFTPRYFYIAFFALTTVFTLGLYRFWIEPSEMRKPLAFGALAVLIIGFGLARYSFTEATFDQFNNEKQWIYSTLKDEQITGDTQIAMVGSFSTTGGFYEWSSGYFQYAFDEPGLRGVLGPEFNFYDPFDQEACGAMNRMSCLDPDRKLIAYRNGQKMSYFLQWKLAGNADSPWTLFRTDSSSALMEVETGTGKDSYTDYLATAGIESDQVLWGRVVP